MLFLQIWNMTCWMYGKLAEGVTVATAREGDYHYSYFMWFTDYQVYTVFIFQNIAKCLRGLNGYSHFETILIFSKKKLCIKI